MLFVEATAKLRNNIEAKSFKLLVLLDIRNTFANRNNYLRKLCVTLICIV